MVVLVIVSVILAVAAPRLGRFYDTIKLDGNAQELRIFLMNARNTALMKRRNCIFYYIAKEKKFILKIQKDPIKDPEAYISVVGNLSYVKLSHGVNLVRAQQIGSRAVPKNTNFSMPVVPMGNKYEYWFTLEGAGQEKINIIVKAGSGIVKIQKEQQ